MAISKKKMDAKSLGELAELLSYYNIYDTTKKSGEDSRPSGPELKAYLQGRLREMDRDIPKPVKRPGEHILLDLWVIQEHSGSNTNLLIEIECQLTPFMHQGNKALKRKPKEIAREVILALFEAGMFNGSSMNGNLMLLLHEDPFKPTEYQSVQVRGIDWVVYIQSIKINAE